MFEPNIDLNSIYSPLVNQSNNMVAQQQAERVRQQEMAQQKPLRDLQTAQANRQMQAYTKEDKKQAEWEALQKLEPTKQPKAQFDWAMKYEPEKALELKKVGAEKYIDYAAKYGKPAADAYASSMGFTPSTDFGVDFKISPTAKTDTHLGYRYYKTPAEAQEASKALGGVEVLPNVAYEMYKPKDTYQGERSLKVIPDAYEKRQRRVGDKLVSFEGLKPSYASILGPLGAPAELNAEEIKQDRAPIVNVQVNAGKTADADSKIMAAAQSQADITGLPVTRKLTDGTTFTATQGGQTSSKTSARELTKTGVKGDTELAGSISSTEKIKKDLTDMYSIASELKAYKGSLLGTGAKIGAKLGLDSKEAENAAKLDTMLARAGEFARSLSSEKGVLTDKDIARISSILPKAGMSASAIKANLEEIDRITNMRIAEAKRKRSLLPKAQTPIAPSAPSAAVTNYGTFSLPNK